MANLLTLKVLEGYTRPVISIGDDVTCLIDTGADTPVWTQGAEILEDVFKAELVNCKKFILSGFGKEAEIVDVYRIFDVELRGMDSDRVIFKSMIVACTKRPSMIASLIIPATAFSKMNYTIRNVGVKEPIVQIEHDKEEYAVGSFFNNRDDRFIERVYSFANEEKGYRENEGIEL